MIATHWEREWNLHGSSREANVASKFRYLYDGLAGTANPVPGLTISIRDVGRLDEVESFLRRGLPGLSEPQVTFLCERADGNPRLMEEIIRELISEPYFFSNQDTSSQLTEAGLEALKRMSLDLHAVQRRRFQKLDDGLRELLGYASWQGMQFLRPFTVDVASHLKKVGVDDYDATFSQVTCPH